MTKKQLWIWAAAGTMELQQVGMAQMGPKPGQPQPQKYQIVELGQPKPAKPQPAPVVKPANPQPPKPQPPVVVKPDMVSK